MVRKRIKIYPALPEHRKSNCSSHRRINCKQLWSGKTSSDCAVSCCCTSSCLRDTSQSIAFENSRALDCVMCPHPTSSESLPTATFLHSITRILRSLVLSIFIVVINEQAYHSRREWIPLIPGVRNVMSSPTTLYRRVYSSINCKMPNLLPRAVLQQSAILR